MTNNTSEVQQPLTSSQIQDILDYLIDSACESKCRNEICVDSYYKNQYLKYALSKHISLPCIVRTYAEMLKTGSMYTKDPRDRKHANCLVSYLNIYSNTEHLDFMNQCLSELKQATFEKYPYLIGSASGRLKSFRSLEAKIRAKLLKAEILEDLLSNYKKVLTSKEWKFSDSELEIAENVLLALEEKNNSNNPIRDLVGYRIIIDSFETSIEEEILINFIYSFSKFAKKFFNDKGFDILESKDYIKHPKENNYQSYHFRVEIMEMLAEVQIRTHRMHEIAEKGTAAHDTVYKNTTLQNYLKEFLYKVSYDKTHINERLGFLIELQLPTTLWCFTPHEEIPTNPSLLRDFEDVQVLKNIFKR